MYFKEDYKIRCLDVDPNGNVRPTRLIRLFQETANLQMYARKPSYYELFGERKSFILTRMTAEILGQIHENDVIESRTWRAGAKAATFFRGHALYRDGEMLARAQSEWTVVDVVDGHIYKTSEIDLSNYESGDAPELSIPKRFRLPKEELEERGGKDVFYSDGDMNRHMNNTNYADMITDFIDGIEEKELTSINFRFRKEAAVGCRIRVTGARTDAETIGDPRAEEGWLFRTYVGDDVNLEAMIGVRKTEPSPFANLYKQA